MEIKQAILSVMQNALDELKDENKNASDDPLKEAQLARLISDLSDAYKNMVTQTDTLSMPTISTTKEFIDKEVASKERKNARYHSLIFK